MRHRAALGISEHSDAITIIVSEQNGSISYTQNGKLKTGKRLVINTNALNSLNILCIKELQRNQRRKNQLIKKKYL